ncbi:MAG: DsbA family oxidoreductase, partial [Alphaproteobacteria bacterium]
MWRNVKQTCRIYAEFSRHISNEQMISIDLFSDPICPWCFIGKRRLEEALSIRP